GITYVDYYSALTTPEGALNPQYTDDRLHPNKAGYDIMEPIVLEAIKSKAPTQQKPAQMKSRRHHRK
ncbi:MAG: hypothetical protein K2J10_00880, partial [Muribaculaceae bacterium]|nr:hypothetical protein [Muribaculaceae bacterium]